MQWASSTTTSETPACRSDAQESVLTQAFRRGVDELVGTRGDLVHGALLLGGGEGAVDEDGPLAQSGRQALDLVLHQGDQRREHQRRARQEQRRKLEGQRLARAGGQDRQRVGAGKHPVDDGGLAGEKAIVAEHLAQRFQDAAVGEWLLRGQRCQVLKLRRRFHRPIDGSVWRRRRGASSLGLADGRWRAALRRDRGRYRSRWRARRRAALPAGRIAAAVPGLGRAAPGAPPVRRRTPVGPRSRPRDRPGRARASNGPRRDRRRARRCGSSPAAARCETGLRSCADQ